MSLALVSWTEYFVSQPSSRIPITWRTFPYTTIPFLLLLTLSYLVRRPRTRILRLALFPFALAATLRTAYGYEWTHPQFNSYNFASGLAGLAAAAKVIELCFVDKGHLKIGELEPGVIETPGVDIDHALRVNASANVNVTLRESTLSPTKRVAPLRLRASFLEGFRDGLESLAALRGIGWQSGTGTGLYVPPEARNTTSVPVFLRQTSIQFLAHLFVADFLESCLKLVPGVGTPQGGSIFAFGSTTLEKYTYSTLIHFITGCAFIAGFQMVYELITLFGVAVLRHHPTSWPPLFESPLLSPSLHDFWAKRWHQLLRQTFLVSGGYPLGAIFGPPGLLFGTFLASGVYHSWALYAMGGGTDWRVVAFFLAQAVGVWLERVYRRVTGRKVEGWMGIVWTWLWVVGGGQWCIDAWHRRGFAGGIIIPPVLSPTRVLLFPIAINLIERVR